MEKKKKMTKEKVKQWAKKHELEIGYITAGVVAVLTAAAYDAYCKRTFISVKQNSPIGKVLLKSLDNDGVYDIFAAAEVDATPLVYKDGNMLKPTDFIVVGNLIKKSE